MAREFEIDFGGTIHLGIEQIWLDGDAPDNPTAEQVAEHIRGSDLFSRIVGDLPVSLAVDYVGAVRDA